MPPLPLLTSTVAIASVQPVSCTLLLLPITR
jgi:hypothetical protein